MLRHRTQEKIGHTVTEKARKNSTSHSKGRASDDGPEGMIDYR